MKNMSGGPNAIEKLHIRKPVEIIIGSTGIVANTKAMVAGVAERKQKHPEKYDALFEQAEGLALIARKALLAFDLKKVGDLMNENHRLLQEISVSCKELDYLVDLARNHGAFGAKLTGGGGGGCMTALTPTKELQEAVATAIEKEGYEVLRTKIGVEKI
jgi:mevalonate kinase